MKINIYEIQPFQDILCEETVQHLEKKFDRSVYLDGLEIYSCEGQPFRYVVRDGHHRLFVCHKLGIKEIDVEPKTGLPEEIMRAALDSRKNGIKSVKNLEDHILPAFLCACLIG